MSPSLPPPTAYKEYLDSELASENERSIHGTLSQVARYGLLKFGVLAINGPFETARLLRQIQYGNGEATEEGDTTDGPDDWKTAQSGLWDSSLLERQRREREEHLAKKEGPRIGELYASQGETKRATLPSDIARDPSGYISERPLASFSSSQWPLILDKKRSLWNSMGQIGRKQGLFSLWQGIAAGWTHEVLMDLGRATMEEALESSEWIQRQLRIQTDLSGSIFEEDVLRPSIIAGVAQGIVGTVLSPVELVRLRLVAQTIWIPERKYFGFWDALKTIIREETGILGLFKYPLLTFTSYFMKPVLRILPVSLLNYYFGPDEDSSSMLTMGWIALQNIVMCLPLIITMPLETIRRRLLIQCNTPPGRIPYVTRVKVSTRPYTGMVNCLWRMLREEGLSSLYQGWGFQVASSMTAFATTLLAELGEEDFGDEDDF